MSTASVHPAAIVDVWSRTASKYRIRAILMLIVLAALFAGLCCFMFWLRTGEFAPWRFSQYTELVTESFQPLGMNQITLSDFLSRPIPVQEVPVQAAIMGMLFASLCSIPIMVTILYRLPFSWPFSAMVLLLAAMPWLALTILIGCTLTAALRSRVTFRYALALIGLIPTAVYFFSASWEPSGAPSALAENQALLYAPWVLAMLSSCVICAVALAIAKLINFRPGGMPPVLALLFVVPVVLFHSFVGRDELSYRILNSEIGRDNTSIFSSVDIGDLARQAATARWTDTSSGSYDELFTRILRKTRSGILDRVEQQRVEAVLRCDGFIEQFPTSPHVPDVLFLKARTQDFSVNTLKLERDRIAEFRADYPSPASRLTWLTLLERFPHHPGCAAALYHLAILDAAAGKLNDAVARLDRLIADHAGWSQSVARNGESNDLGRPADYTAFVTRVQTIDLAAFLPRALALREMLFSCSADVPRRLSELYGSRTNPADDDPLVVPVQELLRLDSSHPLYRQNLDLLLGAFPDSEAAGYVMLLRALTEESVPARIAQLRDALSHGTDRKAASAIRFALADTLLNANEVQIAVPEFRDLARHTPAGYWTEQARRRLNALTILGVAKEPTDETDTPPTTASAN